MKLDINKLVVSNNTSFGKKGFKYLIGYKDAKKFRPLCTFFPKMSAYRKDFDQIKYISFLLKNELLENRIKLGKRLKIVSKTNLTVNQYIKKSI